jgi:hypothetical protein
MKLFRIIVWTSVFILSSSMLSLYTLHKVDTELYPNALCLDGSAAGFWFRPGYGDGASKFIIHHQGGAWCVDIDDCAERSGTPQGSSNEWVQEVNCARDRKSTPCKYDGGNHGLMSDQGEVNPVMFNWNKIYVGYCDGASLSGTVEEPIINPKDPSKKLHFKGYFILEAMYDTFLRTLKMDAASEIVVGGTSAGGLVVYMHIGIVLSFK